MAAQKPCPICGKPPTAASRPFCSERCRDVDLNRWLSGSYAIPASDTEADDDEELLPPSAPGARRSS
ncbi:zinc-binding protein [Afipia felis]|jgi:endogenous inhibitor of DNA gyrase (YacG/DUF329 family)|uniref:DNA gyrase inhibitor YacG n=1 Tax=Afipia felis TaxID=1035 RepID=A0A090N844_AFIFE|nr:MULTISPECIES: DNA gyrase inhibitor YacG [Afipia]MBE0703219.1 DNA gyrase inhibitor YacG [Afipia sp.]CEG09493.1 zinc-binding protein [Afipia felis]